MKNYRAAILSFYEDRKSAGELSINLTYPTPAKLRDECFIRVKNGIKGNCLRIIKSFFEIPMEENLCSIRVKRFDVDKFKPLINFLKRGINTSEKNLELLAWLIGFNYQDDRELIHPSSGQYSNDRFTDAVAPVKFPKLLETSSSNMIKQVLVEYPSGVKLWVGGCDISLISQLIRL